QPVDKLPSPARRRIGTGFAEILRCLLTCKSRLRGLLASRLARCRADDARARSVYQQAAN
ncbi:MAG TPA: hypothetical protein PK141_08595, partial [Polyangiaceae bacterium]|nr:hypothetical protein [Polyangiaceae bacterium]